MFPRAVRDLIASTYAHSYNLPFVLPAVEICNGVGSELRTESFRERSAAVYYNEAPVIRSDGSPIRDYFYVRDCCRGLPASRRKDVERGIAGEAYNFQQ